MVKTRHLLALTLLLAVAASQGAQPDSAKDSSKDGWRVLFNGEDTTGWQLRGNKTSARRFVTKDGKPIDGAREVTRGGTESIRDSQGNPITGARVTTRNSKRIVVNA